MVKKRKEKEKVNEVFCIKKLKKNWDLKMVRSSLRGSGWKGEVGIWIRILVLKNLAYCKIWPIVSIVIIGLSASLP